MSLKHRAFVWFLRWLKKVIPGDLYRTLAASALTNIENVVEGAGIKFHCPSETALERARTADTKEPETLRWIETFDDGDVLWDIGANVGVFTLYAAHRGHRVVALEVLPWNHALLVENLALNGLHELVMAFCVAVTDKVGPVKVNIPVVADTPAGAGGQIESAFDAYGKPFKVIYSLAALGITVDWLVCMLPFPNHIKVDIDGGEERLLDGMRSTLNDKRVKSLMIELQPGNTEGLIREIESIGYTLEKTVKTNHFFRRAG